MDKGGYVYIITNTSNRVLYTGVTSNLQHRIFEHRNKVHTKSFSAKYELHKLVYWEGYMQIEEAIAREKQIKGGSRQNKIDLIIKQNPFWNDLSLDFEW